MNRRLIFFPLSALVLALTLGAQTPRNQLEVIIPDNAPVSIVSSGWGESRTAARGSVLMIDLKTSLRFRNNSRQRLRGVSLELRTEDMAAGGRASVSVPSLDVYPGQEFPVKVDLRLLQPLSQGSDAGKAAVRVQLDGVLFDDLSFFGPNSLQSRRILTTWELEARRDRQRLRQVLAKSGEDGLRKELLEVLAREESQPYLQVKLARGGAALPGGEAIRLAFVRNAESPVLGIETKATKRGAEIRLPEIEVTNRTNREIRFVEYTLLAREKDGRLVSAGSLPSPVQLGPNEKASLRSNMTLEISRSRAAALDVASLSGMIRQVEFSNGEVWIPSRQSIDQSGIYSSLPLSYEMQRLSGIYRKKDMNVLLEELRRFD